jgi:hypothetical protein
VLRRIKNNPFLAALILFGIVVSGIGGFTDSLSRLRTLVFGPSQTETERRLMIEVTHRASEALKQLEQDQADLSGDKQYPAAAIYYNVVCHLNNSCPSDGGVASNYSVFSEYHGSSFQSLIENLMEIEGATTQPQLKRAWEAFKQLDDLSRRKDEEISDAAQRKRRSFEAVANATEIIKSKVIGDYLKSPME